MFDENVGTVLYSKSFSSKDWGQITIQAIDVKEEGKKTYYEIRERYNFIHHNGKETVIFAEVCSGENGLELIKEAFNGYDLEYAEYTAGCTFKAELIHQEDPKAVPVL